MIDLQMLVILLNLLITFFYYGGNFPKMLVIKHLPYIFINISYSLTYMF